MQLEKKFHIADYEAHLNCYLVPTSIFIWRVGKQINASVA